MPRTLTPFQQRLVQELEQMKRAGIAVSNRALAAARKEDEDEWVGSRISEVADYLVLLYR